MKPKLEMVLHRFSKDVEIRVDTEKNKIGGYAVLYNVDTTIGNWYIERIAPGACTKTIMENDIRCYFNHDPSLILGRKSSKTLRISEDSRGVSFECDLPNTDYAGNLRESISRGDVSGCSFSFRSIKEEYQWAKMKSEMDRITLREIKLYELGPVTVPQYESTTVGLRNMQTEEEEVIDFDRFQYLFTKKLRGIGLTNDENSFVKGIFNRFSLDMEPLDEHSTAEPDKEDHSETNDEPIDKITLSRIETRRRLNKIILEV
jgi:HK97 family phage prohead protease